MKLFRITNKRSLLLMWRLQFTWVSLFQWISLFLILSDIKNWTQRFLNYHAPEPCLGPWTHKARSCEKKQLKVFQLFKILAVSKFSENSCTQGWAGFFEIINLKKSFIGILFNVSMIFTVVEWKQTVRGDFFRYQTVTTAWCSFRFWVEWS